MNLKTVWRSIVVAGIGVLGGFSLVMAAGRRPPTPTPAPAFSAWLAYWDGARGRQALFINASRLEEVLLFAYHFSAEDALVPAQGNMKELKESFHKLSGRKPRMAITLVNDVEGPGGVQLKDPACVHRVLSTPAAREAHIQQILTIAEGAESIDVDYERVAAEDGPAFTAFIQALAAALHNKGKRLSVVVEPRVTDGAISWKEIGQAADQLTVMAYLYHYGSSGPGSIAPIDWVHEIAVYGLTQVPADKFCVALHLGGFDWPQEGTGKALEYDKASALAAAYGTSLELDPTTQSGHFSYSDGSKTHDVWIETAAGLKAKVEKLRSTGISRIAFWRLGTGDPAFWDSLSALFSDNFNRPDGLVTNEHAYWNPTAPDAVISPDWQLDSGSFFIRDQTGWTDSAVFRLNSKRFDFNNVKVSFRLNSSGLAATSSTPAVAWDGVHLFLRYQSQFHLYYASINRRDQTAVLKKKCPGGRDNGGTYYDLTRSVPHTWSPKTWQHISATIQTNSDKSVTIALYDDSGLVVQGTDRNTGKCPAITSPGAVGIRGDNNDFMIDDFSVTDLQKAPN